jgi:hypothetical protein
LFAATVHNAVRARRNLPVVEVMFVLVCIANITSLRDFVHPCCVAAIMAIVAVVPLIVAVVPSSSDSSS